MYQTYPNIAAYNHYNEEDSAQLMTPPEMALYLGIGRNMAYQLLNEGSIKGFRIGKKWFVSKDAVNRFIAKNSNLL